MAADSLRKFMPRAPRYVLRPSDRNVMRFSLAHSEGAALIETTILLNLSESGVAFLVKPGHDIKPGDRIKVEIPIPNGDQIAWWGTCTRVNIYEPSSFRLKRDPFLTDTRVLVAIRFESLPKPHTRAIRRGLEDSFIKAVREQQYRNWVYYRTLIIQNAVKGAVIFFLTLATVGLIYWLSRPDSNYDAKRGAPWGERFKF